MRAIPSCKRRRLGTDGVVAHAEVQVVELGFESPLKLVGLHVDVTPLDVGDVAEPGALRPPIKHDQNDSDHRTDDGQG